MIVADVMTAPAVTIAPDEHVKEALRLLDCHAITALPVVTGGRLVGVVSEADLIREALPPDLGHHLGVLPDEEARQMEDFLVAGVMNHHPMSVRVDTDLAVATALLTETGVKSLPVLDEDDVVVGVVSRCDVVRVLARPDADIEADLDDRLRLRGDWLVEVAGGVATIDGPETDAQRAFARATAYMVPGVRQVRLRS
jgi:CBS-domain-containing membrane protein